MQAEVIKISLKEAVMRHKDPTKTDEMLQGEILATRDLLRSAKTGSSRQIYEPLLTASLLRLDLIASPVGCGPDQDEVLLSPVWRVTPRRFIWRTGISQHLAHRLWLSFTLTNPFVK